MYSPRIRSPPRRQRDSSREAFNFFTRSPAWQRCSGAGSRTIGARESVCSSATAPSPLPSPPSPWYLKLEELDSYDLTVDGDLVTVACSPYKSFWGGVVLAKDEVETFPILTRFDSRTLDVLACQLHHVWDYDCFQKMFMPGGENFGGGTASRVAFLLITLNKLWVECTYLCAELIPALRIYVADLGRLGKVLPTDGGDEVVVLTQEERNWVIGL